jgi:S-formylglutathione hydrolase FrmB
MNVTRKQNIWAYPLKYFNIETLMVESRYLRGNALKDPFQRINPLLIPKKINNTKKGLPVILVLSGFTGNGTFTTALNRNGEENHLQQIDTLVEKKKAPHAIYVFVDALTRLGGSQFLNSKATGNYESYIIEELVPAIKTYYPAKMDPEYWCLTGASSGGYGALHLGSKYPKLFGNIAALAPDCDFTSSYFTDLMATAQFIANTGGFKPAMKKMIQEELFQHKKYHQIANGMAMAACYSADSKSKINFPIDIESGEWRPKILKMWKSKDPLIFIPQRKKNVRQLDGIFLGAGRKDEFFLHFGARKLLRTFKKIGVSVKYEEFSGGHFDVSELRPSVYGWLKKKWK